MTINDMRSALNLTQRQFAHKFGIPIGTLRNWEQGISKPSTYVFSMILNSIRRDDMINVETIKFIMLLNELAELSKNGIRKFSEANFENLDKYIFYDESSEKIEKYRTYECKEYKIVLGAVVDSEHRDIISYYDSESFEYTIRARIEDDILFILVKLLSSEDEVVIENGRWYFVN